MKKCLVVLRPMKNNRQQDKADDGVQRVCLSSFTQGGEDVWAEIWMKCIWNVIERWAVCVSEDKIYFKGNKKQAQKSWWKEV